MKRPRMPQLFQSPPRTFSSPTPGESDFERQFAKQAPELYGTARTVVPRIPDLREEVNSETEWDPWEAVCRECATLGDGVKAEEHPMWGVTLSYIQEGAIHLHFGPSSADLADFVTFFPLLTLIYNYNANMALSWELMSVGATRPLEIGKMLSSAG